jgi:hypothetical protein
MINKDNLMELCNKYLLKYIGIQYINDKPELLLYNDISNSTKAIKYINNLLLLESALKIKLKKGVK